MAPPKDWNSNLVVNLQRIAVTLALTVLVMLTVGVPPAHGQTWTTLHSFSGPDGNEPEAGLTMDREGNLYGTAYQGGNLSDCGSLGCGTVFKLTHSNSGWLLNVLYTFHGPDGANPMARVIFGPDGSLYGTTVYGGSANQGTVFKLTPPPSACRTALCPWTETVLHSFQGGGDGEQPALGDLVFDQAGNIYGTTPYGGLPSGCYGATCGVVYELTPSNGGWTEEILYRFSGGDDGGNPFAGLIFDTAGNLYGATAYGESFCGVVYKLTPSGSRWSESVISSFTGLEPCHPEGGLIFDQAGNLYGVDSQDGVVYELTPSGGTWTLSQLYNFDAYQGSFAKLAMDPAGNLYGTLFIADSEVFKLTPSNGGWTQTGFSGGDGLYPFGNVILDANGNVYGTASSVAFEITP